MIVPATDEAIPLVCQHLAQGNAVALPTETVYGLAADASSSQAVAAIYRIKGRPAINPLIAHVSDRKMACRYVEIDPLSQALMKHFWPGPLTLVLPLRRGAQIAPAARAGLSTLAIRQPQGIFARIVNRFDRALVAPSANRSGRISPTSAQAVKQELDTKIPLVLDGGSCPIGIESTIVKVQDGQILLLRTGGLARQQIEERLGKKLIICTMQGAHDGKMEAPGMLTSHYAPLAKIRLEAKQVHSGEMLLAFGRQRVDNSHQARQILNLSEKGDLTEAATHLFDYLRQLDKGETIAVEPIPDEGLGEAINDRLRRAAAPR